MLVGYGEECDTDAEEISLQRLPGAIDTLAQCLDSCERSSFGCTSISFLAGEFCNHFSTACDATKPAENVVSFLMERDAAVTLEARVVANMQQQLIVNSQSLKTTSAAAKSANTPHFLPLLLILKLVL